MTDDEHPPVVVKQNYSDEEKRDILERLQKMQADVEREAVAAGEALRMSIEPVGVCRDGKFISEEDEPGICQRHADEIRKQQTPEMFELIRQRRAEVIVEIGKQWEEAFWTPGDFYDGDRKVEWHSAEGVYVYGDTGEKYVRPEPTRRERMRKWVRHLRLSLWRLTVYRVVAVWRALREPDCTEPHDDW